MDRGFRDIGNSTDAGSRVDEISVYQHIVDKKALCRLVMRAPSRTGSLAAQDFVDVVDKAIFCPPFLRTRSQTGRITAQDLVVVVD